MKEALKSFFLVLVFMVSHSFAQTEDVASTPRLGWVTIGGGVGGAPKFAGMAGGATASYYNEAGLFSLRLAGVGKLTLQPTQPQVETQSVVDLSGMYGFSYKRSLLFLAASSGLGFVWVTENGPTGEKRSTTIGVPLELQAFMTPLRVLGLGVTISANINAKQSYASAMICMQFGKVK